jgi:hypothetical protein
MLVGIYGSIERGYSGYDHLIDSADESAVMDAVAGQSFRRSSDALKAAEAAFEKSCDCRVIGARIRVRLRTARGDLVDVG